MTEAGDDYFGVLAAAEGMPRLLSGLALLQRAHRAHSVPDRNVAQGVVSMSALSAAGLTTRDVEFLLDKGLADFAASGGSHRHESPRAPGKSGFPEDASFVLTRAGATLVTRLFHAVEQFDLPGGRPERRIDPIGHVILRPHWDAEIRELRFGRVLVKRFRNAAPNQERLLQAFEQAGWPDEIEDPLPSQENLNATTRLKETIQRLNRTLQQPLILFDRDHSGRRVKWRYVGPLDAPTEGSPGVLLVG